ncbi:MAG TPA: hypothetical protein VG125_12845 [Pirellulales bacterium]|jgi:hypothetical protein|nr:hypothetical protein [Pirellulales bacterium]
MKAYQIVAQPASEERGGKPLEEATHPHPGPLPQGEGSAAKIVERFGSLKRAFSLVRRVTGDEEWQASRKRRIEDLTVYLALAKFRKRPPISKLPRGLQRDIREFFGTYKRACELADELLFQAGSAEAVDEACCRSPLGKFVAKRPLHSSFGPGIARTAVADLRGMRAGLLGRNRRRNARQAAPFFGQGFVPGLSGF